MILASIVVMLFMIVSGNFKFKLYITRDNLASVLVILFSLFTCFTGISVIYFSTALPKQKKVIMRFGLLSVLLFYLGKYGKSHQLLGSGAVMAVGLLLFCFTFLPLFVNYRYQSRKHIFSRKHIILSFFDLFSFLLIVLSVLFKYMHWLEPSPEYMLTSGIIGFVISMLLWNRSFSSEVLLRHKAETELKQAFAELHESHLEIEEKNKEILDSITYAQRIQKALLASDSILKKNLPDHFVLFKPKDIVSGDFYWACEAHGKFYFIIADSTGHGVPGAFMSLLNISFLNEAINEKNIQKPNDILAHVRSRLIASLAIEGSTEGGNDGMDCILMCLNKDKLEVSCAHNPLLMIVNGELMEIAADKIPVGKSVKNEMPFTLHTIDLKKGDILYAFTDGFADQFGGPNGKKLKYKQLCQTLLANKELSLKDQREKLLSLFTDWKGSLEQVDDVLIAGIKI
jgi:serine phosphatase RsbU (regulator of sigma subunit)